MARSTRRERRAADPSQPGLRVLNSLCVQSGIAAAPPAAECVLFLSDSATGLDIEVDAPVIEQFFAKQLFFYRINLGARRSFASGFILGPRSIYLIPNDPQWVVGATVHVFTPVWALDIVSTRGLTLAPFWTSMLIEA